MQLQIENVRQQEKSHLLTLSGRLDTQTYLMCEERLQPLISQGGVIILDLKKLDYISSMGLRVLLKARKSLESRGGQLILVNVPPQIARIFEIANALPKQNIFASVEEADRYFAHMQKQVLEELEESAPPKPHPGTGKPSH
jgi:anti-sigma B factor antagonist